MENFTIRKYRQDDYEDFIRLWELQMGEAKAKKMALYFKWLIEGNPFSNTQDDYFVIDENGKIIAYDGLMPFKFSILGKDYDGYIYHDTLVHPDKRGQGLGSKLIEEIGKKNQLFSVAVWMNLPNSKTFEKCGWIAVDNIHSYARIYNVAPFVQTKSDLFNNLATRIINLILVLRNKHKKTLIDFSYENYSIKEIDEFDDRVDSLFHSVKKDFRYISYRTKDILNWKYAHKAFSECSKLIYTEGEELKGYIVYRTRIVEKGKSKTTIFDFLCSLQRKDVLIALLKHAILRIEKTNSDYTEILSTNPTISGVLKDLGFIKIRKKKFALKFRHAYYKEDSKHFSKGNNWFFTYGDGDNVFWHSW